jgi:methionine-rich copper-binding protein CopC
MRYVALLGGLPGNLIARAVLATALLAPVPGAYAHAFLERASPPVGSEIAASPPEVSIIFTEGVEPLFSRIEVAGADGAAIATGKQHVAPDNNRRLIIELPKLPPGTYTVIWHVTSVDTHKTEGNYKFTLTH